MKRITHIRHISFYLIGILLLISFLFGGTTGKISGKIEDENGDALIGVNVQIVGTKLGAATDQEGLFTILFVPPGNISVTASYIGYKKVTMEGVRVFIDQTSRIDIVLPKKVLEGDEIIVRAGRKIIREDVATSVVSISGEELAQLPLANVEDAIELQAGIEDGLVVRGGESSELLLLINGATMRDPRTNKPISRVALSAVHELSIERGGFNAEYGQVRSGLINIITREGAVDRYQGSITTRYGPPGPKHFGLSPYDKNSMWLRPYLDDDVCWTGTENGTWTQAVQKQYPTFDGWNNVSSSLLSDDDASNDLTPAGAQKVFLYEHRKAPVITEPDYNIDLGFGGPVPVIGKFLGDLRFFSSYRKEREMLLVPLASDDYEDNDFMVNLSSDISSTMKINAIFSTGSSQNIAQNGTERISSVDYMRSSWQIANQTDRLPGRIFSNSWYSLANVSHITSSANFTHTLSPKSFYRISLENVNRDYETGPIDDRDTVEFEILDGYFVNKQAPFGFSSQPDVGITGMFFGGHTSTSRDSSQISSLTLKADYTNQITTSQLVKTGIEYVYHDLNLDYGIVNVVFPGSNNYVRMKQKPIRGAAYLQDKLELNGYIVNIGLRLDYNNGNTNWTFLEPFSNDWKEFNSTEYSEDNKYKSADIKEQYSLSPRLAVSHPISSTSKLFFNYGHFNQLPTYEEMFRMGRNIGGAMRNYGNPELGMSQTISYELGFDKTFKELYILQLAGYYHDIVDQLAYTTYYSADGSVIFNLADNNSYEDIRGFEITFRKYHSRWWSGFINYTYQVKSSGLFGKSKLFENPSEQREYDTNTKALYQSKPIPQPFARANLTISSPSDFGPKLGNFYPLGGWSTNTLLFWREGYFTYAHNVYPGVSSNSPILLQYNNYSNISMKIHRDLKIGKVNVGIFAEINNLFNTKRLSLAGFYNADDQLAYFQSLHLPESSAYQNIIGSDRIGEFRDDGVEFQPILQVSFLDGLGESDIREEAIYFESSTDTYQEYEAGTWVEVPQSKMGNIFETNAYIDMPNQTSFNFLNPRNIFMGLRISYDF